MRGWPEAFQRMPPSSQMDRSKPHEHRAFQERDSASIDSAKRRGRTAVNMLWIRLIATSEVCQRSSPLDGME